MGWDIPNDRKDKGWVNVDEGRGDLVEVVEDETISPGDNSRGQGAVRHQIAGHKECWAVREHPDIDEAEDVDVVAEVCACVSESCATAASFEQRTEEEVVIVLPQGEPMLFDRKRKEHARTFRLYVNMRTGRRTQESTV